MQRTLAAQPGTSPEKRAARELVVRYFYEGREGLGEDRCEQDLKSIDREHPVEVIRFPPPTVMHQNLRAAQGKPGNWFDPDGGQPVSRLGISGVGRVLVAFSTPEGEGLLSIAAPINDDWTDPESPLYTEGGGKQIVVDDATRDRFRRPVP